MFRPKIEVLHEGIRTDRLIPDHDTRFNIGIGDLRLTRDDEIVTYIARNLEPARGFHTMLRALPKLQRLRPNARVVIIGGDNVSYGARLGGGKTFRQLFTEELGDRVDWSRVHFVGSLPYEGLMTLLKISRCHVYLTVPFVVSWSFLEAMALEKTVVASDVAPVRQFAEDGKTALLVDFFDTNALALRIADVLRHPDHFREIGRAARRDMIARFDFQTKCYPEFLSFLDRLLPGVVGASDGLMAAG
jgi:glycosyltransferase involved in cell wall biosynthesis